MTTANVQTIDDQTTAAPAANTTPEAGKVKLEWGNAWRAVRALMKDKEDTTQVFEVMRALRGDAMQRGAARFKTLEDGQRILKAEEELLDTLKDRDWLATLPEGSLGREYLAFMIREGITAEGLVESSVEAGYPVQDKAVALYGRRLRDQHDLWHVVTGYGRDGVGEACVVAFSYPQTKSLGFAVIAAMAGYTFKSQFKGQPIVRAVWQAYLDGRRSEWLPGQDWRHLLTLPIGEVRQRLKIRRPSRYLACEKAIAGTGQEAAQAA